MYSHLIQSQPVQPLSCNFAHSIEGSSWGHRLSYVEQSVWLRIFVGVWNERTGNTRISHFQLHHTRCNLLYCVSSVGPDVLVKEGSIISLLCSPDSHYWNSTHLKSYIQWITHIIWRLSWSVELRNKCRCCCGGAECVRLSEMRNKHVLAQSNLQECFLPGLSVSR